MELPLDFNSPVTGIYMENLISLWCEEGLTTNQAEMLVKVSNIFSLNGLFTKCLDKDKFEFELVRNRLMATLDKWEEVPAWDEVCRLKLAFDSSSIEGVRDRVKRYTILMCMLLPPMTIEREVHEDYSNLIREARDERDPKFLWGTPDWYQKEFKEYQVRQAKRDNARQVAQETMLRFNTMTEGFFNEKRHDSELPPFHSSLAYFLKDRGEEYPLSWWAALEKSGVSTALAPSGISSIPSFPKPEPYRANPDKKQVGIFGQPFVKPDPTIFTRTSKPNHHSIFSQASKPELHFGQTSKPNPGIFGQTPKPSHDDDDFERSHSVVDMLAKRHR
ncbi:hypothetical protein FALBO_4855 [Fusarium albosuccineum]|uniref:Uncharacterized protein n=1 Tax=Fusarium albosuccineum TaxID=1237068 RepID=A0A8H4LFS8_9HYPO|nr:hypothetical protein FALBO_4855 [Fusarium albosuccineum]